jgi:hypothetical protein
MSEYPSTKPTSNLSWDSTTNGVSEPSTLKRTDGWGVDERPPAVEFNWMWKEYAARFAWLVSLAVRRFSNLYDACNSTSEMDVFSVAPVAGLTSFNGTPYATQLQQSIPLDADAGTGTRRHICCDGMRIFYYMENRVVAQKCEPGVVATELWHSGGFSLGRVMACDGSLVAIAGAVGGDEITIYEASDGTVLYNPGAASHDCVAICCDSGNTYRDVYWEGIAAGNENIYRWREGVGKTTWFTEPAGEIIKAICATENWIIIGAGDASSEAALYRADRSNPAATYTVIPSGGSWAGTGINQTAAQHLCSDGRTVFWLISWSGNLTHLYAINPDEKTMLWEKQLWSTDGLAVTEAWATCDDKHVYASARVGSDRYIWALDKVTGRRVWAWQGSNVRHFATDGIFLYILTTSNTIITVLPSGARQHGELWTRANPLAGNARGNLRLLAHPHGARR